MWLWLNRWCVFVSSVADGTIQRIPFLSHDPVSWRVLLSCWWWWRLFLHQQLCTVCCEFLSHYNYEFVRVVGRSFLCFMYLNYGSVHQFTTVTYAHINWAIWLRKNAFYWKAVTNQYQRVIVANGRSIL